MRQKGRDAKNPSVPDYKTQVTESYVMDPAGGYPAGFKSHYKNLIFTNAQQLLNLHIKGRFIEQLQEFSQLSADELADIIGISRSKYYRLIKEAQLGIESIDSLSTFLKLWNKGVIAFDGNDANFREWLHSNNHSLGGIRPIELLKTETGRREIERAIDRIEYSVYG